MKTYKITLWVEDTSTGETFYKEVSISCNPLCVEDAVAQKIATLPSYIECSGWDFTA